MSYFVTGGTGFIGRYVLERLLERKGRIYVLVRPQSKERMDAIIERLGAPKGRIVQVAGDITEPHLGLSQADRERIKDVDHFLHLGAVYDITAGDQINRETNVGGTINAVRLSNSLDHATFHHISTIAVAGRYNGVFREDMFDAGQKLEFPYDRTKFEAEQIVREELTDAQAHLPPGDRRRRLQDRRDRQDRRSVPDLQVAQACLGPPARVAARPWASPAARSTWSRSISPPARSTT